MASPKHMKCGRFMMQKRHNPPGFFCRPCNQIVLDVSQAESRRGVEVRVSPGRVKGPVKKRNPRGQTDIHRVLRDPITMPSAIMMGFEPNWEPHDDTINSDGLRGSYFWFFEEQHDNNPVRASVGDAHADLIMFIGWRAVNKREGAPWADRWNRWWEMAKVFGCVGVISREVFKNGNGIAVLARTGPGLLDFELQDLPARGFFPIKVRGRFDHYLFRWPRMSDNSDFSMNINANNAQRIEFDETVHIKIGRPAGGFFGRPPAYQAMNLMNELLSLLMIFSTMARRSTHGLIHAMVDVDELEDEARLDPDTNEPIMSEREERLWQVQKMLDDRVAQNLNSYATEISNNMVTAKDVTLVAIDLKNDMAGAQMSVDTLYRTLDRSWRMPRLFQGEGESSNRAIAVVQERHRSAMAMQWWRQWTEEFRDKIFPILGIPKEEMDLEPVNELLRDEETIRVAIMGALDKLALSGFISFEEGRAELDPFMREVDLKNNPPPITEVELPAEE